MSDFVVHCKRSPFDVYIGRRSGQSMSWGNPFSHLNLSSADIRVPTRNDAVSAYAAWLNDVDLYICSDNTEIDLTVVNRPQHDWILEHLSELKGKVLGCWCAPQACHGDVLVRLANELCSDDEAQV